MLGHFFPPIIDKNKDPDKLTDKDIIKLIENWFLRDKDTYHPVEVKDRLEYFKSNCGWTDAMVTQWKERFYGQSEPRRWIDDPNRRPTFRMGDILRLFPGRGTCTGRTETGRRR